METTEECLDLGIKKIKPGVSLNEYARAVQEQAEKNGFSVVRDLVGHGIGRDVHEPPQILNYADPRMEKIILKEGMTLALEPMVNEGGFEIFWRRRVDLPHRGRKTKRPLGAYSGGDEGGV